MGELNKLREFYVLRVKVRVVLEKLLHRSATARHLADLTDGQAAVREHRLTAEDVVRHAARIASGSRREDAIAASIEVADQLALETS